MQTTRRAFLKQVTAATAVLGFPAIVRSSSPNNQLNIAGIGVGGKGAGDIAETSAGQNVVAICDVDANTLGSAAQKYTGAKKYDDWRKLLEQKDIDAVTVSTPDHMHAPIAMSAMQLGKHVYVQKPMAHTVYEARQMAKAARDYKVVSQMGNQGHSGTGYRTLVKAVQSGVIGRIKEAHTWSNRPIWPQGIDRPSGSDPVPAHLNWEGWLGVAPYRPYVGNREEADAKAKGRRAGGGVYHPFKWRGWLDFGVGALGDMGCHIIDPVVWSLDLDAPTAVWSDGPAPNGETYPSWEIIHYQFPKTKYTAGPVQMTWYDGGKLPARELVPLPADEKTPTNGCLLIGENGVILCEHGKSPRVLPDNRPLEEVPGDNHYQQWTKACKGEGKATSHFDYAGPLTETVLLGTIAIRFPGVKLQWNSKVLTVTNVVEANRFVHHPYRQGWHIEGLS
ncbi:MAG: Gfo/Idh/MocA family oxidoreductase [Verrucomicrobiota bacterium]